MRIILMLLTGLLYACGQTGPLYLPGSAVPASETSASLPADSTDKETEDQQAPAKKTTD